MTGYLLDTNCISEAVRAQPEARVEEWIRGIDEDLLYVSVLTFGEIRKGIASLPESKRRERLEVWLTTDLRARFGERILAVDYRVADRWGALAALAKKRGRQISIIDGLLAATAIEHGMVVATRNEADFAAIDCAVINPWKA